jgi:hypothetical protein
MPLNHIVLPATKFAASFTKSVTKGSINDHSWAILE